MNDIEAGIAVELLGAAFPRAVLSPETKRFYHRAFRGAQAGTGGEIVDALSDLYDALPSPKAVRDQIERSGVRSGGVDLRSSIRKETNDYVALRERLGQPVTFVGALEGHRAQCVENARDDPAGPWKDRISALDELLAERGVGRIVLTTLLLMLLGLHR